MKFKAVKHFEYDEYGKNYEVIAALNDCFIEEGLDKKSPTMAVYELWWKTCRKVV